MKHLFIYAIVLGLAVVLLSCSKGNTPVKEDTDPPPSERIIQFSGFDWVVRKTGMTKAGPGPNFFSDSKDNVWVDADNRLHLRITQRGGHWYCSGISLKHSLGYGKYTFYVNSDLTTLDQNVVAGMFTYLNDNEEIDIEFSKWSVADNQNAQFAIQPADVAGNKFRYDLPSELGPTLHSIDWRAHQISFESAVMNASGKRVLQTWDYAGAHVPTDKDERLKINLWLFRGQMPSDRKEQEIVLDKVTYEP